MQLARVIGTVVATVKNDLLEGRKLHVIQPLDGRLNESGKPMVAIDSVGAGKAKWFSGVEGRKLLFLSSRSKCRPIAR